MTDRREPRRLPPLKKRVFASDISWMLQHAPLPDGDEIDSPTREDLNRVIRSVTGDNRVVKAFENVDRAMFVADELQDLAYVNEGALPPTETSPVMSKPSMVAKMTALLELTGEETVLEVGAGSGYGAAILSEMANKVHSIEVYPKLAESAAERLKSLGFNNVDIHQGDGIYGVPDAAPFDAILVTAAVMGEIPGALLDQLAPGGRMVLPIRPNFVIPGGPNDQMLLLIRKSLDGSSVNAENKGVVRFLPLETTS
jgi:protein-L-isoaspartate(D-aspartate) O-methyltransferase